jgi:hypothetical protein
MAKDESIFVATDSGVCAIPGDVVPFFFTRGLTQVRAGHPVLKLCPAFFEKEDQTSRLAPDGSRHPVQ